MWLLIEGDLIMGHVQDHNTIAEGGNRTDVDDARTAANNSVLKAQEEALQAAMDIKDNVQETVENVLNNLPGKEQLGREASR